MIGTVTTISFFVLLLIFAMVPPYFHYWMFQIFFRCKHCPTILVENELALGELPQRVSRQLYLSVYGGMFILVLIPQLTQNDSIGTIHGVTKETLDVQRTDLQTASGYLAAFTTFPRGRGGPPRACCAHAQLNLAHRRVPFPGASGVCL
jgi:hypothetical protein